MSRPAGVSRLRYLVFWALPEAFTFAMFWLVYGFRRSGTRRIPPHGPLIYVSNHGSNMDPPLVACLMNERPCSMLARRSLFDHRLFGWLLRNLGGIPLERGRGAASALRAAEKGLATGRCILLFPEGTRSRDGTMGPFRSGAVFLARRTGATIVPVGLAGTYDAWPPGQTVPRLGPRLRARVGLPIPAESLAELSDEDATERVREAVVRLVRVLERGG